MRIRRSFRFLLTLYLIVSAVVSSHDAVASDPLAPWRSEVSIRLVAPEGGRHTIHSYFNTCPESPDGRHVLFFSSTAANGHHGEVRIRDRDSGTEKVLAADLNVEDAHRVACQ